jgi:protein O-GlcNAc transferase
MASALEHQRAGRTAEAERFCRAILAERPDDAAAWHLLGVSAHQTGRQDEAAEAIARALALSPDDAEAMAHLALVERARGRLDEAMELLRRAIATDPRNAEALINLGVMALAAGEAEEALSALRRAARLEATSADAQLRLAYACRRFGRLDEAAAAAERAIELDPCHARAHDALAQVFRDRGRLNDALALHHRALVLDSAFAGGWNNLGNSQLSAGLANEAIESFERALTLEPDFPDFRLNLARAFIAGGRAADAKAACRRFLEREAATLDALCLSGEAARSLGEVEVAIAAYRQAIELGLDDKGAALGRLADLSLAIGYWDELALLQAQAIDLVRRGEAQRLPPFLFMRLCGDPALQRRAAVAFTAARHHLAAAFGIVFTHQLRERPRLRLGYLSSDFHDHATATLLVEVIELHDRAGFEVLGYSFGRNDGSPLRRRIVGAFDRFVDLRGRSTLAIAEEIHRDGVDILVDLKGYTEGARPEIAALRPAPVQVSYLGYPGSTGAEFIDYLIADPVVAPLSSQASFTEALALLPRCYQPADRQFRGGADDRPTRASEGLPAEAFVFCCFHNAYKLGPEIFAVWMALLRQIPAAVLWLLATEPALPGQLRRRAIEAAVAPERLIFASRLEISRHLARLPLADIYLDTLPVCAHTTASDALRMGLPAVTCPGEAFAGRVAASLLTAAGLPELIARDLEDYRAIAVDLASNPAKLLALKARLANQLPASSLLDTPGYTRDLERAYRRMWENWRAGNAPTPFALDPTPA